MMLQCLRQRWLLMPLLWGLHTSITSSKVYETDYSKSAGALGEAECSALHAKAVQLKEFKVRVGSAETFQEVLDRCEAIRGTWQSAAWNLGTLHLVGRRDAEAHRVFSLLEDETVGQFVDSAKPIALLQTAHAAVLQNLGRYHEALSHITSAHRAVLRAPRGTADERQFAAAQISSSLHNSATKLLQAARSSRDSRNLWGAAIFLSVAGRAQEAVANFRSAESMGIPEPADSFFADAAEAAQDAGQPEEVIRWSKRAVALNSSRSREWLRWVSAETLENGEAAAVDVYRQALKAAVGHLPDRVQIIAKFVQLVRDVVASPEATVEADLALTEAVSHGVLHDPLQLPIHFVTGLSAQPWHNPAAIPAAGVLMDKFGEIRSEIMGLGDRLWDHAVPQMENLLLSGAWRSLKLFQNGQKEERSCRLLPRLVRLLETLPEATSQVKGWSGISIIAPGTVVRPHNGPTNTRIRLHLGVSVPDPASARLRVGKEWRHWAEGSVLAFDDSFEHEVHHNGLDSSGSHRIVLLVDIWHPELTDQRIRESLTYEEEKNYSVQLANYNENDFVNREPALRSRKRVKNAEL